MLTHRALRASKSGKIWKYRKCLCFSLPIHIPWGRVGWDHGSGGSVGGSSSSVGVGISSTSSSVRGAYSKS